MKKLWLLVFWCWLGVSGWGQVPSAPVMTHSPSTQKPIKATSSVVAGCAVGAGSFPSVNHWTFSLTPQATTDACVFMLECHPSVGTVTSFSLTAPGWTISPLKFISDPANQRAAAAFGAIVPNTSPTTFTATATGASNCSNFAMHLGGEATGNDPTGGSTTFEVVSGLVGTDGMGCNDGSLTPLSDNDFVWFGCVGSVSGVNAPYTLGATDGTLPSDAAAYTVLTGGAGLAQQPKFTSPGWGNYIVMGVGIKPAANITSVPSFTTQPQGKSMNSGQSTTLEVVAIGSPSPTLQWYQGTSGNMGSPINGETNPSYTTPTLTTTTSYWVRATNSQGTADSGTATITIGVFHSVTLSWNAPTTGCSGSCTYNLYRGPTPGSEILTASGITKTGYGDSDVIEGRSYCYQVNAQNSSGGSGRSNEICVTIPNTTNPGSPGNFTISVQ